MKSARTMKTGIRGRGLCFRGGAWGPGTRGSWGTRLWLGCESGDCGPGVGGWGSAVGLGVLEFGVASLGWASEVGQVVKHWGWGPGLGAWAEDLGLGLRTLCWGCKRGGGLGWCRS